jgi:hypothetical protein
MTPKNKRIHLIEKNHKHRLTMVAEKIWESGCWDIPESTAKKLLKGSIILHEKPKSVSFFGGIIINYRLQADGKLKGMVTFTFEYDASHRGVITEAGGWSKDMKIVVKA